MKNVILFAVLGCFIFSSCKKSNTNSSDSNLGKKKYPVNFQINDFRQIITSVPGGLVTNSVQSKLKTAVSSGPVLYMYYYVYNSAGNMVRSLRQVSTDSGFGHLADSLAAGNYTVVFVAGQSALTALTPEKLSTAKFYYENYPYVDVWDDVFFKKMALTVEPSSNSDQTVNLERIVAKLMVNITDAIPANVTTITLTVTSDFDYYYFASALATSTPTKRVFTFSVPAVALGTINYQIQSILVNTVTPFTVNISSYDSANQLLTQVNLSNITCTKNQTTLLSGNLFTGKTPFQISLNSDWDTPVINHF